MCSIGTVQQENRASLALLLNVLHTSLPSFSSTLLART